MRDYSPKATDFRADLPPRRRRFFARRPLLVLTVTISMLGVFASGIAADRSGLLPAPLRSLWDVPADDALWITTQPLVSDSRKRVAFQRLDEHFRQAVDSLGRVAAHPGAPGRDARLHLVHRATYLIRALRALARKPGAVGRDAARRLATIHAESRTE